MPAILGDLRAKIMWLDVRFGSILYILAVWNYQV